MHPRSANSNESRWVRKGLRNRYRPDHRISRGMVTAAPWIDTVLLISFFGLLTLPFVLQPGIAIDLPVSSIGEGHQFGHNLMAILQTDPVDVNRSEEIVFFDDRRFHFQTQKEALREALRVALAKRPDLPLIIEADRRMRHGLIVELFNLAAEAGVERIHIATRPVVRTESGM